jgi:hypothetical protein
MSEITAFGHLLQRAVDLCIHQQLGTTWWAITLTAVSFLAGRFGGKWRTALTANWKEKLRPYWRGTKASLLFLALMFALAVIQIIYTDHTTSRAQIAVLKFAILERDATIRFKDQQLLSETKLFESSRQQVAPTNIMPRPATVTIKGNGNAGSVGQTGGVTAGTINGDVIVNARPDRVLSAADKRHLLKALPSKGFVTVEFMLGDSERSDLAKQIVTFLRANGYSTNDSPDALMSPDMPKGIVVESSSGGTKVTVGENK